MNTFQRFLARSSQAAAIIGILIFGVVAGSWILSLEPGDSAVDSHDHDDHAEGDEHEKRGEFAEHEDHESHEKHDFGGEESRADHSDHDEGRHVDLSPAQLKNAKIKIEQAQNTRLAETLVLNGLIVPNQEQLVHVVPRFPGVIQAINKSIGQSVEQGDVLARIESNQSLKSYDITSPISGTVLERAAALGEFTDEENRLMVIADLSTVWIDFRVYQRDFERLNEAQIVRIQSATGQELAVSEISYISPFGSSDTQTMMVRAVTDNSAGRLRPGLFVTGIVELATREVPVAVKQTGIQYLDGKPVIFVMEGDEFVAIDVELGQSAGEYVEVLSGIKPGDRYASDNSFTLKAELGKGLAAHEH